MRGQCGPRRNAVALVETAPKILLLKQKKAVLSRCEIVSVDKPIAFINPAASFSLRVRETSSISNYPQNSGGISFIISNFIELGHVLLNVQLGELVVILDSPHTFTVFLMNN